MSSLEQRLRTQPEPYVAMSVGIPGSGKTTVLSAVADRLGIVRVSPDEIRGELAGDQANQTMNSVVWSEVYRRTGLLLADERSVVIDATGANHLFRRDAVSRCRALGAASVVAVRFCIPLDIAVARNAARNRVVPERVLVSMFDNLAQYPVSQGEGFDEVISLQYDADGGYEYRW